MEKQSFFWTPSFKPCFSFVFLQYSIIKPFPHFFPGKKCNFSSFAASPGLRLHSEAKLSLGTFDRVLTYKAWLELAKGHEIWWKLMK
jgi:hypothetical protein